MKKYLLMCLLLGTAHAARADAAADDRKLSYYFGYQAGKQFADLQQKGFRPDTEAALSGLRDMLSERPMRISEEQADELFARLQQRLHAQEQGEAEENAAGAQNFLAANLTRKGVHTTASGLQYTVKRAGSGTPPRLGDEVNVSYKGRLEDGTVFDENADFVFTLSRDQVIAGWAEGLQLMKKGGSYTLFVPPALGYGNHPPDDIPANAVLVFDIDVLNIQPARRTAPGRRKK